MYITFLIFPHNRHLFVRISPSVLEVWKFPCGRTPFQPSEDTDALLSELPSLCHNVVHAAYPSQIWKDGSRRVPDQGYRRGVEELPTPSLPLLPMWGERRGGERCHAGWWCFVRDVYRAVHDGACAVSGQCRIRHCIHTLMNRMWTFCTDMIFGATSKCKVLNGTSEASFMKIKATVERLGN